MTVFGKFGFHKPDLGGWGYGNKLAKLGDAIAISKSETMNHSLTDRGRCKDMLSHLEIKS